MKSLISRKEYVLIALGILTIPIGIGLILLACVAWRIGTKMENHASQLEEKYTGETGGEFPTEGIEPLIDETYKCDEYAKEVLEDGR